MFINKNSIMIKYIGSTSGNPKTLGLYELSSGSFVLTNDTSFQSNKSYYVGMGQYLVEVKYGFNKLWASDSGRNLAGVMSGTLIGIFVKLTLQFRRLNKAELELITPILDASNQSVTYYDPTKKTNVTMTTYSGDYDITNKRIIGSSAKNEGFSCSLIAVRKRS